MEKLIEKYRKWHGKTDREWKVSVIRKCQKEAVMYIDDQKDIDWLYDDCIDYLTLKTTRKIINLAKKMGYKQPPCHHCQMIIKHWNNSKDCKWTPDVAHLF